MVDYIGTAAGVREICRNLGIGEVSDLEIADDLKYGYGKVITATRKDDWDGTEIIYGLAVKVNEEFAAVNIALRTNVDIDTIALIRKIANEDMQQLADSDPSLTISTSGGGGGTATVNHGTVREYKYYGWDTTNNDIYMSPDVGSGNDFV